MSIVPWRTAKPEARAEAVGSKGRTRGKLGPTVALFEASDRTDRMRPRKRSDRLVNVEAVRLPVMS
jgi:hypothetical protein